MISSQTLSVAELLSSQTFADAIPTNEPDQKVDIQLIIDLPREKMHMYGVQSVYIHKIIRHTDIYIYIYHHNRDNMI